MSWPWRHRGEVAALEKATAAQAVETRQVLRELGEIAYALVAWTDALTTVVEEMAEDEAEDA